MLFENHKKNTSDPRFGGCFVDKFLQVQDFVDIKLDARNLIEADVKSALTDLDWFGKETAGGTQPVFRCKRRVLG